jgi:prevent-host-death family protein
MLIISSKEFRNKQAEYMDKADTGEQIIVQRNKNKAYTITPISDSGMLIDTQTNVEDFISGKQVRERVHKHIDKLFAK